jgi:hypothetical protein
MNSLARIRYRAPRGINTWFTFHFLWTNENASAAVINIDTRMFFTGACFAQARGGAFTFNESKISLSAQLNMVRNTGWGSDPLTGDGTGVGSTQQLAGATVASLKARGGPRIFFQGVGTDSASFYFQPVDLSVGSFLVPPGASILFMPTFYLYCTLEGDTLEDVVDVDFSTVVRAVRCPYVALTIQTPT